MHATQLEVRKSALSDISVIEAAAEPVAQPGEAVLRIERFGLSSNNVTYAAMGDAMDYWNFFPSTDDTRGRVPVWGFAEVVESLSDAVVVGERLYGYLPMATHLVVTPADASDSGFTDAAPHRSPMAAVYNRYQRADGLTTELPNGDNLRMLLHPLFATSWLIADAITDGPAADASQVVLSSASSKTSIGVAHALAGSADTTVVGLTSPAHVPFVVGLGVYDLVVTYDDIDALARSSTVYVDMAGNASVTADIHRHLGDALLASLVVGMTHWDAPPRDGDSLPGPQREFFFAPTHIAQRTAQWGPGVLDDRLTRAWNTYATWANDWLHLQPATGPDAITAVWQQLVNGGGDPDKGHVCTWQ